ncbi:bifunctional oligoribonuclease/PAP phosphatase NrnA [Panacibacter ginsenosidivorans]|uniref:Bifunctional oligoribonuclease/PAP phosphatase NrnA n=1 Tax=Panacibacter ginsenosidivorans TaxID=1813871 RepID=A0A5B8V4E9_9BACT|nr:bifunctional oligoribonuclease/PAP phosphatase NrnA [Panacibacter ginsenosidivorans]QEC65905.1 bifunctional oligoribonuclease/PAP phosphatase NrnA [Panacibacter ginsenosidivorans]
MQEVRLVYPLLAEQKNVIITTHQKPDGDAMGAALGLYHFLTQLGHKVTVISPTNWANFLNWMPGCEFVMDFENDREAAGKLVNAADMLFCLDFNVLHRTKNMEGILAEVSCVKVLIDHHQQPQVEAFEYGISDVSKSSTCEMVYDFIEASPFRQYINKDIATCLFTGIMTDTGSFRFSSTTPAVHRAVAALKETGINHTEIFENIYDNFSESRLRFIGNALLNRLEVLYEYNTALMAIPKKDILKYEIKTGDTEGLVNYLLTIEGIKLGALLIDRTEERKWSFRSKGDFDVNVFARTHFEGGGHKNAAGGRSSESIEENVQKFKTVIQAYEQQLQ